MRYDFLRQFLSATPANVGTVVLSFHQIELVLRDALPFSACDHRQWWENQLDTTTHPKAAAWTQAGFQVKEVSLQERLVQFTRTATATSKVDEADGGKLGD